MRVEKTITNRFFLTKEQILNETKTHNLTQAAQELGVSNSTPNKWIERGMPEDLFEKHFNELYTEYLRGNNGN